MLTAPYNLSTGVLTAEQIIDCCKSKSVHPNIIDAEIVLTLFGERAIKGLIDSNVYPYEHPCFKVEQLKEWIAKQGYPVGQSDDHCPHLLFYPATNEVSLWRKRNNKVKSTPLTSRLLSYVSKHVAEPCSFSTLAAEVWDNDPDEGTIPRRMTMINKILRHLCGSRIKLVRRKTNIFYYCDFCHKSAGKLPSFGSRT